MKTSEPRWQLCFTMLFRSFRQKIIIKIIRTDGLQKDIKVITVTATSLVPRSVRHERQGEKLATLEGSAGTHPVLFFFWNAANRSGGGGRLGAGRGGKVTTTGGGGGWPSWKAFIPLLVWRPLRRNANLSAAIIDKSGLLFVSASAENRF